MFNTTNIYLNAAAQHGATVDVWTKVMTLCTVVMMLLTALQVVRSISASHPDDRRTPRDHSGAGPHHIYNHATGRAGRRRVLCHTARMAHMSTVNVEARAVAGVRRVADCASATDHVSVVVTPTDQARDWRRRWLEIERRSTALNRPRAGSIGGDSVHVARDELHSFYIECYHLKDALIAKAQTLGITKRQVEDAITADPVLALLADLANLDKHAKLNTSKHSPRSGHVPAIGYARGASVGSGWRLELPIVHAGTERDGLDVARQAVEAWRRLLTSWELLAASA